MRFFILILWRLFLLTPCFPYHQALEQHGFDIPGKTEGCNRHVGWKLLYYNGILRSKVCQCGLNAVGAAYGSVVHSFQNGSSPPGTIQGWDHLDQLYNYQIVMDSMEFLSRMWEEIDICVKKIVWLTISSLCWSVVFLVWNELVDSFGNVLWKTD